jgi:hypothetical protein
VIKVILDLQDPKVIKVFKESREFKVTKVLLDPVDPVDLREIKDLRDLKEVLLMFLDMSIARWDITMMEPILVCIFMENVAPL